MVDDDEIIDNAKCTAARYVHVEYVGKSGPALMQ